MAETDPAEQQTTVTSGEDSRRAGSPSSSSRSAPATYEPYPYKSLSTEGRPTRLLKLHAPTKEGTPVLSLCEVDLDIIKKDEVEPGMFTGAYDAVSYVWGPALPAKPALLDGHLIGLAENIWRFLVHYAALPSHHASTRLCDYLWIDAICIDQQNFQEKARQVRQMSKVFSTAAHVIIWLGENSLQPNINFDLPWTEDHQHGFQALARDPFWKRLWVVQEVLLAREALVVCESRMVEFPRLRQRWGWSSAEKGILKGPPWFNLGTLKDISNPSNLAAETVNQDCSDPLDHIYALLGFIEGGEAFDVEYGIPPEKLFWKALADFGRMIIVKVMNRQDMPINSLKEHKLISLAWNIARSLSLSVQDMHSSAYLQSHLNQQCHKVTLHSPHGGSLQSFGSNYRDCCCRFCRYLLPENGTFCKACFGHLTQQKGVERTIAWLHLHTIGQVYISSAIDVERRLLQDTEMFPASSQWYDTTSTSLSNFSTWLAKTLHPTLEQLGWPGTVTMQCSMLTVIALFDSWIDRHVEDGSFFTRIVRL